MVRQRAACSGSLRPVWDWSGRSGWPWLAVLSLGMAGVEWLVWELLGGVRLVVLWTGPAGVVCFVELRWGKAWFVKAGEVRHVMSWSAWKVLSR